MKSSLSLEAQQLGYAAVNRDVKTISDRLGSQDKQLPVVHFTQQDLTSLFHGYQRNPEHTIAYARRAITDLVHAKPDAVLQHPEYLIRYVDQYLDMIISLDAMGIHGDTVYSGVPDYIADGFVDFGSEQALFSHDRQYREKIIVDKGAIFAGTKKLLINLIATPGLDNYALVQHLYYYIAQFRSCLQTARVGLGTSSIPLDEVMGDDSMVCRHKALLFQVLAQTLGITCRLVKCHLTTKKSTTPHVANLVCIGFQRYLVDTTLPLQKKGGECDYYIRQIPEKEIDIDAQIYTWSFIDDPHAMTKRIYTTRNNMYYQVR